MSMWLSTSGDTQLSAVWRDPDFDPPGAGVELADLVYAGPMKKERW